MRLAAGYAGTNRDMDRTAFRRRTIPASLYAVKVLMPGKATSTSRQGVATFVDARAVPAKRSVDGTKEPWNHVFLSWVAEQERDMKEKKQTSAEPAWLDPRNDRKTSFTDAELDVLADDFIARMADTKAWQDLVADVGERQARDVVKQRLAAHARCEQPDQLATGRASALTGDDHDRKCRGGVRAHPRVGSQPRRTHRCTPMAKHTKAGLSQRDTCMQRMRDDIGYKALHRPLLSGRDNLPADHLIELRITIELRDGCGQ